MQSVRSIVRILRGILRATMQEVRDAWAYIKIHVAQGRGAYEQAKADVPARHRTKSDL